MKFIVSNDDNGRVDKFLSIYTDLTRSYIEKLAAAEKVLVNDNVCKLSYRVKEGDVIEIDTEYTFVNKILPADIDINIVYEDQHLIVVNKQSGLVVHPGSGNRNNTLVNALINYTDTLSGEEGDYRAGIVHRIDKDTSGLLVVAKTDEAHNLLSIGFRDKTINREYIALVEGVFPSQNAKINAPIAKSKIDFRKQEVVENGKVSVTNLAVMKRFDKYTLVRLSLETGRTHQIRVHLEYIGYPIFNDPVYNNKKSTEFGQFLHSHTLDFVHPITQEKLHFEAPLPDEFTSFIDSLD